jgi:diguanylate cyclase
MPLTAYLQSREESVVLLKRVIAEMSLHDAPFTPYTFAVWYEHFAAINPALSSAVQSALQQQPRLSADMLEALFRDHVAPPDDSASEAARTGFQRVMQQMADTAARTGESAVRYGHQLAGLSRELGGHGAALDRTALQPRLSEVADGTSQMQEVVASLVQAVAEGRQEVVRLREALDRSRVEAVTDALSGLHNRKGFDHALRETLATPPHPGRSHCLVLIDIDHFKRVNDTHGHPVGDTVITTIGQVLLRVARGAEALPARIGGEEFALILRSATSAQAVQIAEGVLGVVRSMKIRKRGSEEVITTVTVSAGIAAWMPGDDPGSLLAAADAALYRAKGAGRDRIMVA